MLARIVDLRDQLRRCHSVRMRDFFQAIPECIFEADARLVSVKDDRAFDDRGFHERLPKNMFAGIIWRFGVARSSKKYRFKKIILRCGIGGKLVV